MKALGCLAGLLAVALAAAGAHLGLAEAEGRMLGQVTMLLGWHASALLVLGLWGAPARWGGALLAAGLALLSLGVLVRVFGGVFLGPVAPTGGIAMMVGWAWLGITALRRG